MNEIAKPMAGWRCWVGCAALVLALVLPLLALAVPWLGLSAGGSAVAVGVLVVGGPEVMLLLAAALLGKQAIASLVDWVKGWFWRAGPAKPATPADNQTRPPATSPQQDEHGRGVLTIRERLGYSLGWGCHWPQ